MLGHIDQTIFKLFQPLMLVEFCCTGYIPVFARPSVSPMSFVQCYSDPTHVLRNYLDEQKYISIRISGGENSTETFYKNVHPKIKEYKYGVAQPGEWVVDIPHQYYCVVIIYMYHC